MSRGQYDGMPGLVWYTKVKKVRGDKLKVGDWLDSLDHRGAREIIKFQNEDPQSQTRTAVFYGDDTETVRKNVTYDVVDPHSQVAPDGS